MEFYITQCIAGFIAFDEDLQIADYKRFTEDEVVSNLIKIEENEILDEEIELINGIKLDSFEEDRIIIETTKRKSQYKELENYGNIEVKTPNKGGEYLRSNIDKIFEEIGFSKGQDEIIQIYEKLAIHKNQKIFTGRG
jgi:hypothetical protein